MKKYVLAAAALSLGWVGCGGAHGEDPGRSYMPDMYYSRAYEAYGYNMVNGEYDSLQNRGIRYNGLPVSGTVARGEQGSYHLTNDSAGLLAAEALRNPLDTVVTTNPKRFDIKEAERLYLVNCGICHGPKLDGNGPIVANGAYPAVPPSLADGKAKTEWTDGHFFHVVTFGKGSMGSYAAQLRPEQRWAVIKYIRSRQGGGATGANMSGTGAATKDSTGAKDAVTGAEQGNRPDTRPNAMVTPQKQ